MSSATKSGHTVINLDEVLCNYTDVSKTVLDAASGERVPRTWSLRDDVPVEVMLRVFDLMELAQEQQSRERPNADAAPEELLAAMRTERAAFRQLIDLTVDTLLDIWRHSYPEMTAEQLRAYFNHEERMGLVRLFFTRRLVASSNPSSATTPSTSPEEVEQTPAPAPNRATRRRASRHGGIPSQKALKRELGL